MIYILLGAIALFLGIISLGVLCFVPAVRYSLGIIGIIMVMSFIAALIIVGIVLLGGVLMFGDSEYNWLRFYILLFPVAFFIGVLLKVFKVLYIYLFKNSEKKTYKYLFKIEWNKPNWGGSVEEKKT